MGRMVAVLVVVVMGVLAGRAAVSSITKLTMVRDARMAQAQGR